MNYFLFEQYLLNLGKTQRTVESYVFNVRKFIELHPNYATYEFKDISEYIAELNKKYTREDGRVTSTVNSQFYSIKALYMYLIKKGARNELPFSPSFSIKGTHTRGLNTKKLFSPEELERLVNFVKTENLRFPKLELRNQLVIGLLVNQALLSEEILKLRVEDVDLDSGRIYIRPTVSTAERTLSLHPTQFVVLFDYFSHGRKALLKDYEDNGQLIISARPMTEHVGGITTILQRYTFLFPEREMTAMAIRQSVIYKWLNFDKRPLEIVQTWAGHKWPSSTERYVSKMDMDDPDEINGFHPMELL